MSHHSTKEFAEENCNKNYFFTSFYITLHPNKFSWLKFPLIDKCKAKKEPNIMEVLLGKYILWKLINYVFKIKK